MSYNVEYWTKVGRARKHVKHACFASYPPSYYGKSEKVPDSVIYKCPIDKILNLDEVKNYLEFLKKILPEPFQFHISKKTVFYKIQTAKLSRYKALLHLTAFRYLDEYPDIVAEMAKLGKLKPEKKFESFQLLHFDYVKGTLKRKSDRPNNMAGHGLMFDYAWNGTKEMKPIELKTFKERCKSDLSRVHDYFKGE